MSSVLCDSKKSKFIKASGLLSSLGIKTSLSKTPLVGPLLFKRYQQVNTRYKMNEIVNKFLVAGDRCMAEMHLQQTRFTYSACGHKTGKKSKNLKQQEINDIFFKMNQTKVVFNMTWLMETLQI